MSGIDGQHQGRISKTDQQIWGVLAVLFSIAGFFLGSAIIIRFFQAVSFLERIAKASEATLSLLKGRAAPSSQSEIRNPAPPAAPPRAA